MRQVLGWTTKLIRGMEPAQLTPGAAEPLPGSPEWWDARYASGEIPWDTGIVPPEVVRLVEGGAWSGDWALDLGCGRGTSTRYLARHGLRVVGVDLSLRALGDARRLAARQPPGQPAYFCAGSVADLGFLAVAARLALDVGCFHSLPGDLRAAYVHSLAARLVSGAVLLLYALDPRPEEGLAGPPGLAPGGLVLFAPYFTLRWVQHGLDRERPSAWYLLQRTNLAVQG